MNLSHFVSSWKNAYLKIILVVFSLAIIGLSNIKDYGITWDEPIELDMVRWNIEWITQKKPISEHSVYHGFIFNYFVDRLEFAKDTIQAKIDPQPPKTFANYQEEWNYYTKKATRFKHIITFLFSLLAYAAVAGIVAILAGIESAWFAPIVLALFPRFWGHSFFNPKDIPFATLFILTTFAGACLLGYYSKVKDQNNPLGFNKITLYSILYGMITGLVTGVRIGGFLLLFFILILNNFWILATKPARKNYLKPLSFAKFYLLIVVVWALMTTLVYPASWSHPVEWFTNAVLSMSKFSVWNNKVLFQGQHIWGKHLPWFYMPYWVTITVPILFQIAFVLGVLWSLIRYRQLTEKQRACVVLVLLQVFFLPLLAIIRQSTMYDEIRHFLFIIPGMAAIAATTLIWAYQKINNLHLRIFALTLLIIQLSPIVIDMIRLHPYQYIYFNRAYGGLAQAENQMETEYWGLSLKEGMTWLNEYAMPNSTILVAGPMFAAEMFSETSRNFNMIHRDEYQWETAPKPDYYIAIPRYDYQQFFRECPLVYAVRRQNTPLTIVRQCQNP